MSDAERRSVAPTQRRSGKTLDTATATASDLADGARVAATHAPRHVEAFGDRATRAMRRNPALALGAAVGIGTLLATTLNRRA